MMDQKTNLNQLPNELKSTFQEPKVLKYLGQAGIVKRFGFSSTQLFKLIFVLLGAAF